MIELELQWIHSGGFSSQWHEVWGTALHHRHQSRMLNETVDTSNKFGQAQDSVGI